VDGIHPIQARTDVTDSPSGPPADDFSIGDVAAATGITPETLRVWERRYGRPQALRLPSGHRRYTADQIRWVRRIAEALARGHRPHKVVPLDDAALDALLAPEVAGEELPAGAAEVLDLVRSFRATELRARLAEVWDPDGHLEFMEAWIAPIVHLVGRAWADGKLEIRHEHFASEILQDVLRSARNDFPVPDQEPRVVLTTLSGETHGLGLQMAALSCAAHGVPYRLLGVDTPNEEIVRAASELGVSMVALSVSLATGGVETDRQIAELRKLLPRDVQLVVGGGGARGVRRGPRDVVYVQSLAAWDEVIAAQPHAA
jgi:methanogenic corrinoid protein MtbC1